MRHMLHTKEDMAKGTNIHRINRPAGNRGPTPNKKKRMEGSKPSSKAIPQTPAVQANRKPADRIWGGV